MSSGAVPEAPVPSDIELPVPPDPGPPSRGTSLDVPEDPSARRPLVDAAVLVTIAVLLVFDLIEDARDVSTSHAAIELAATAFAVIAAGRVLVRWIAIRRALERRLTELQQRLRVVSADAERWRAEARDALAGLGAAIDRQCDRWALTDAERAVALLLLKGLSLREIAEVRGTAERTARQQALSVYRKAGLAGRAELAAFFLEDLLLPSTRTPPPTKSS